VESNRDTEIIILTNSSRNRERDSRADVDVDIILRVFLNITRFYQRYVYEFIFREKVNLSEAHSGRGKRATSKELRDR
jgi:hypothetical protein